VAYLAKLVLSALYDLLSGVGIVWALVGVGRMASGDES